FAAHRGKLLVEIDQARRAAWEGWERSKQNATRKQTRKIVEGQTPMSLSPIRVEKNKSEEGQAGDAAFLFVVLKCNKREAELVGAAAPRRLPATTPGAVARPPIRLIEFFGPAASANSHSDGHADTGEPRPEAR